MSDPRRRLRWPTLDPEPAAPQRPAPGKVTRVELLAGGMPWPPTGEDSSAVAASHRSQRAASTCDERAGAWDLDDTLLTALGFGSADPNCIPLSSGGEGWPC
jgi:hypothetical protein